MWLCFLFSKEMVTVSSSKTIHIPLQAMTPYYEDILKCPKIIQIWMAFCIYTSLYYCWHVMSVIILDYLKNKIISFSRLFRIYSPTFLKTMHTLSVWFKIESSYITTNLSCFALFKEKKEYKWNKKRKRKLSKEKKRKH